MATASTTTSKAAQFVQQNEKREEGDREADVRCCESRVNEFGVEELRCFTSNCWFSCPSMSMGPASRFRHLLPPSTAATRMER